MHWYYINQHIIFFLSLSLSKTDTAAATCIFIELLSGAQVVYPDLTYHCSYFQTKLRRIITLKLRKLARVTEKILIFIFRRMIRITKQFHIYLLSKKKKKKMQVYA